MSKFAQQIGMIVKGEDSPGSNHVAKGLLRAASVIYAGGVKSREVLYRKKILQQRRLPCKIISVGNLSLGGTGKTPMTIYLAQLIKGMGYSVCVLSRGYKGRAEKRGGVVGNGDRLLMTWEHAGDEPFMMAGKLSGIPVVIGKDRYRAGMMAVEQFNPDIMIMDDGFQHLRLFRDLDLVLLDFRTFAAVRHLFPRGPMRESFGALNRADACIFTRSGSLIKELPVQGSGIPTGVPVFFSTHIPRMYRPKPFEEQTYALADVDLGHIRERSVYAFSGIANNEDFRKDVEKVAGKVNRFRGYPDHYRYTDTDLADLTNAANDAGAETIVTTEKDWARIGARLKWPGDVAVMGIETSFGTQTDAFLDFVENRLGDLFGLNRVEQGVSVNGHT